MPPTGCRDDLYADAKVLERREPGRVDSRKQATEVRLRTISTNRWNSRPLWTYPDARKDEQGRGSDRPEDADFDLVSYAPEDRGGVENPRPALSLPVDPDKAQPKRRQLAVALPRGRE
jgi:hypothetical protein